VFSSVTILAIVSPCYKCGGLISAGNDKTGRRMPRTRTTQEKPKKGVLREGREEDVGMDTQKSYRCGLERALRALAVF
jgi:hypothetical protein